MHIWEATHCKNCCGTLTFGYGASYPGLGSWFPRFPGLDASFWHSCPLHRQRETLRTTAQTNRLKVPARTKIKSESKIARYRFSTCGEGGILGALRTWWLYEKADVKKKIFGVKVNKAIFKTIEPRDAWFQISSNRLPVRLVHRGHWHLMLPGRIEGALQE